MHVKGSYFCFLTIHFWSSYIYYNCMWSPCVIQYTTWHILILPVHCSHWLGIGLCNPTHTICSQLAGPWSVMVPFRMWGIKGGNAPSHKQILSIRGAWNCLWWLPGSCSTGRKQNGWRPQSHELLTSPVGETLTAESGISSWCSLPSSGHGNSPRSLVTSAAGEVLAQDLEPWEVWSPWGGHRVSGNLACGSGLGLVVCRKWI